MVVAAAIAIASLLGLGAWAVFRARAPGPLTDPMPSSAKARGNVSGPVPDSARAELANNLVTERLWKLAFAAPSEAQLLEPAQAKIRDAVAAALQSDSPDPKYFPRRPTLMPQLMRAVDDPRTATDKLSRIVAHDPVLTSDVLRLANSALYRTSPAPIETIQRAIVILGVDALRGLVATAMLQPVFRATRSNFPRFPRMLWERTERAARAAEMYAMKTQPQDRFEAQLVILLSALGPLVVYGAALDMYAQRPQVVPNPTLCVALTAALGPQVSKRIARHWETSPRLVAAIERSPEEALTTALCVGELLGTLSLLRTQSVITSDEALATAKDAGLPDAVIAPIWERLTTAE
ncbi:MAG TPA: HDOD domain-containing protein [Steroidobacteraceae bacterium]|jgi:HD-like signal output (HDOD) protein|nr:HDOD domain-containing protein [Steroidobacteraceae bacterium]